MTQSELHAIMVGGMATIAGSVYVSFGAYKTFRKKSPTVYC
jgi:nucleoside permease NupC